jgi:hypothetical protein
MFRIHTYHFDHFILLRLETYAWRVSVRIWHSICASALEVWYAQQLVERLPRLRGRDKHHINYRHVIDWLVRKPGAFAMYKHRAALFPSHYFRVAYDDLRMRQPSHADKEYLQILHLAAKESETQVEAALRELLTREQPIAATAVEVLLGKSSPSENSYHRLVSETQVEEVDLNCFDALLMDKEVPHESGSSERTAGNAAQGTAFADGALELRGAGPAGGNRDAQLRTLPIEPVRSGMSGTPPAQDRAAPAAIVPALGEDLRNVRPETPADEGGAADAESACGRLRGSQGKPARLWEAGLGEDAFTLRVGERPGASGAASVVHDLQPLGAGPLGGETRPEAEPGAEAIGELRSFTDDLGYVQQNREEMEVLFTLLADRYERGSLWLTSNLPSSRVDSSESTKCNLRRWWIGSGRNGQRAV